MLDLVGAEPLPDVAGRSFRSFLRDGGANPDWNDELFAEYTGLRGDLPSFMIRSGPWKLNYYFETESCQLFNLDEDSGELRDRAADADCREVLEALLRKIEQRWDAAGYLAEYEKERRAGEFIRRCGHELSPHEVTHFSGMPGYSQFDYTQLPIPPRPKDGAR